jgi:tetratricopeptide (TPR) repeat protein
MFNFLKRFFGSRQQTEIDPDDTPEEYWQADFRKKERARFADETGDSYSALISANGLSLDFHKKNIYAWTVNPLYRYRDFVLESLVRFPLKNGRAPGDSRAGSMAAGFLIRYLSESTFYSILISDGGLIRMDALVNGTPIPVLGWTEITPTDSREFETGGEPPYANDESVYSLRLIAQGTSFTIVVNDRWVAQCQDDMIQAAGKIAFAAQNWGILDRATATLEAFVLDSRATETEITSSRWNHYLEIKPEARINLARTWYAMGKYVPAIIELKRAWKDREPQTEELLLSAQIFLAQRLLPEAEEQIRKVILADASSADAYAELGGILYLQNRYIELDDLIQSLPREMTEGSAFLSNLEGHLLRWKGSSAHAAEAYHRAATLNPDQGLFFFHEGNELMTSGNAKEATDAWLEAARLFLANESYDDLENLLPLLAEAASNDARVDAIAGKYLYATGNGTEAAKKLDCAITGGTADSAVWYLSGMLASEAGHTDAAIARLRKAVELEAGYGPYWFRLAETLFFAGEDCDAELERALELDEKNGWVHNLAALKALGEDNVALALAHIERARSFLPNEMTVLINYAEICRRDGRLDEALALLDADDADSLRSGANLLVEDGRHEEAEEWYVKALHKKPFDAELMTDRAANCLELELINEADDLLTRALDIAPSVRIYRLISYLGRMKGEYARAEVALIKGLEDFRGDAELLRELGGVYLATKKPQKAADIARRLREAGHAAEAEELERESRDANTVKVSCSSCDRVWRVPKEIPAQGSLHLTAEPPDDVPAGTCPTCGSTYCIGCAKESLGSDGRFRCKKCGVPLRLIDQNVIWLLNRWQETV